MKIRFSILFFFVSSLMQIAAVNEEIVLSNCSNQHNHNDYYPPADMPEVYYDADLLEIIIYADGFAGYYDLDIISLSTMSAHISTRISGYGEIIDISLLPDDDYKIVITSSNNNVYEGQFTNY